jgi:glycosyltransferase involved in cell wall biosynthesis
MTTEPLVSICIPTYDRELFLAQALDSVLGQMGDEVEIVISDNASTDGTQDMVRAYQAKHPEIAYYRNAANLGFDKNVLLAIERARGRYVWLLGSDDLLNPGAIDAFRSALRDRPDLVMAWVNYEVRDRDLKMQQTDQVLRLRRNLYFADANRLLAKVGHQLSFMSSLVLRRDIAMACLAEVEPFVGGMWVQLVLTLLVAKRGPTAVIAQASVVRRLNYSPGDYEYFGTFSVGLNACLRQAVRLGYSRFRIAWIMNRVLLIGPIGQQIWHLKANREPGLREARRILVREYRWFPAFWLLVYPTFWVPAPFASAIRGGIRLNRCLVRRVAAAPAAYRSRVSRR